MIDWNIDRKDRVMSKLPTSRWLIDQLTRLDEGRKPHQTLTLIREAVPDPTDRTRLIAQYEKAKGTGQDQASADLWNMADKLTSERRQLTRFLTLEERELDND